ncbi:MAG: MFS transporter [Proteiniphilum sp.]|nr:MFS transporter [Proteiniphilum sp.]MDD4158760.1 MFS transporter [Proteiniphilum sp.]MDD4800609.1 MFS transporter [Proteiniphilum sp.]
MKQRASTNLFTFFTLYIAQSIPMSFFATALPVLMRQGDYSLFVIALLKLIKLPWILKCLWSPLVDCRTETVADYKRWIIGAEIVYALLIFVVAMLRIDTHFTLIIFLILLAFISSATQDIATDAMAARSFERRNSSLLNSIQSMGSFTGSMVGGGFLLLLFHRIGWSHLLPWVAIFVLAALLPLALNRKITLHERTNRQKATPRDMLLFFSRKQIWRQILFLTLFYAGLIGILSSLSPYLVDRGYRMKEIGAMVGIFGVSTGILCAFVTGLFIRKKGKLRSRRIISACILLPPAYFLWLSQSTLESHALILIGIALIWGTYGMASTMINTAAMDIVRDGREGTDFTLQIVLTHLSAMIISLVSARVGDLTGYSGLFAMELALAAVSFIFVLFTQPFRPEEKEGI